MTKEQAIEHIKKYRELDEKLYNTAPKGTVSSIAIKKCLEFWDMAIQALSQECVVSTQKSVGNALEMRCDDTVSIRKDVLKCRVGNIVAYNVEWLKKHWQMEMDIVCGVKPCDDAISREAVIEWLENATYEDISYAVGTELSFLPSVTHKSGKWILTIEDWNKWTCSKCGYVKRTDIHVNIGWKYCPNCGAKMESEDKE